MGELEDTTGTLYAFHGSYYNRTIDEDYVSGLSITYSSNPRQHIWTFASGSGERFDNFSTALVPLLKQMILLLMLVVTITVSQAQHIKVILL